MKVLSAELSISYALNVVFLELFDVETDSIIFHFPQLGITQFSRLILCSCFKNCLWTQKTVEEEEGAENQSDWLTRHPSSHLPDLPSNMVGSKWLESRHRGICESSVGGGEEKKKKKKKQQQILFKILKGNFLPLDSVLSRWGKIPSLPSVRDSCELETTYGTSLNKVLQRKQASRLSNYGNRTLGAERGFTEKR